jgi:hypothetical protein
MMKRSVVKENKEERKYRKHHESNQWHLKSKPWRHSAGAAGAACSAWRRVGGWRRHRGIDKKMKTAKEEEINGKKKIGYNGGWRKLKKCSVAS